jgi:predicted transcriptional regulator
MKDDVYLTIRIETELRDRIKILAKRERRSMSEQILYFVDRALNAQEAKTEVRETTRATACS